MRTIIIGLGNPILSDDSVGIKVARSIREKISPGDDIDVAEVYAGGIRLMDAMVGYDRAFIVDAMVTGSNAPGTIRSFRLSELISTRNLLCAHDMNLPTAIEMGRMLGMHLPSEIMIWGIEASDVEAFGEELTEDVAKAVPIVIEKIMSDLKKGLRTKDMRNSFCGSRLIFFIISAISLWNKLLPILSVGGNDESRRIFL